MSAVRLFPLGIVGGIIGWPAIKAVVIPLVVWSSTAAGTAAYVNWVIKSHRENALLLESKSQQGDPQKRAPARPPPDEAPIRLISETLSKMVAARTAFLASISAAGPNLEHRDVLVREDVLVLEQADKLRRMPSEKLGAHIIQNVEARRRLDDRLRALGAPDDL